MSSYKRMSPEDRQRAIDAGLIQEGKKRSDPQQQKKTKWTLVWIYCGKEEIIMQNKPYAMCVAKKNEKSKEIQYKNGEFKIK